MADDVTSNPRVAAELAPIRVLVARARTRLRLQGALEGATTSSILASASALAAVFAVRTELIASATGLGLLAASAGVVAVGAVLGALGKLDDEQVARRIDRACGLADRLSSAVAFDRALSRGAVDGDDDTQELMRAAMRDAAAIAPRANVVLATPLRRPTDLPIALSFAAIAAVAAMLGVTVPPKDPRVIAARPDLAKRGASVVIEGERLCGPKAAPTAPCTVPAAMVYLGDDGDAVAAPITAWTGGAITITIPTTATIGKTELVVWGRGKKLGAVPFEVLDKGDRRNAAPETMAMAPDDAAYTRELVAGLRDTARRDQVKALEDFADKVDALLDLADNGEITKAELLKKMQEAQAELDQKMEQKPEEITKDLAETGQELKKNDLTKELGAALEKGDLDKAKAEMEKLAEQLDQGALDDKQAQDLAKTLEKAAQQFDKKQDAKQDKQDQQAKAEQQKAEEEIRRLEKKKDEAKTPEQREEADRRLDKKKDELAQLKKKDEAQQQKEESTQREALKRLHKDMDKVAKSLQQKPEPGQDKNQQNQDNQKQASRNMKDVADETGKVDQDQRKQAAQKKVASQMEDLREAMRRAKQQGKGGGGQNPFGKNGNKQGQQQDFAKRASGGKGKGQGKGQGKQPGQGQGGPGQGQGENGGDGKDPNGPSNTYGDGHDDNLVGDATDTSGNTTDESVSGAQGRKGPSRRETILAAAQKGYASKAYQQVFAQYKTIVEEVMRTEKVPPSYKYYVKKYFTKIKPHSMD